MKYAQTQPSEGESHGSSSNSELSDNSERLLHGTWMKRGAFSALALALTATGAFFVVHSSSSQTGDFFQVSNQKSDSGSFGIVELQQNNSVPATQAGATTAPPGTTTAPIPCVNYDHIDLEKVEYSNLGGAGPQKGPEGLVYAAGGVLANGTREGVLVTVNATTYKPNNATEVGLNGTVGYFNINSFNTGQPAVATLTFRFWKMADMAPFPISSITFMDLDALNMMDSVEYVKVKGFVKYTLSNTSLVAVTGPDAFGAYTFRATMPMDGSDNPTDPTILTKAQLDKSFTVEFPNMTTGFEAEIGCSAGNSVRQIGWVARPSILCYRVNAPSVTALR